MAKVRRQAADWAVLIDEWRESGLSLPALCRLHGLSRGTMQNWVYKPGLKRAGEAARCQDQPSPPDPWYGDGPAVSQRSPTILPVHVAEVTATSSTAHRTGVEVVLGAGRRVVLEAGFDSETLRRVVAVLEGRPC